MPAFSANLSLMFGEHAFVDRFAAARDAGFEAVEFLFPYGHAVSDLETAVRANNLSISVFNLPPGDWDAGERGMAALPEHRDAFRASIETALSYASAVGAQRLHVMAGNVADTEQTRAVFIDNIRYASERFADAGLTLLIEPLNPFDAPGYFLSSTDQALDLIARIDRPNVRLQFDVYHHQIIHGDVIRRLAKAMPMIGHMQIAGVPDRHEPDIGELNYPEIFRQIDSLGYQGWVGCEYRPRGNTLNGLGWLKNL
ncbi:MAG: hydroxypyruvate isomerase family protein [Alphaproteobacteria bacterium]|nr:hydroxypyruvate isomerase family protein [Alphaproteobacteria bacterium]